MAKLCNKPGCPNEQAVDSNYCTTHKPGGRTRRRKFKVHAKKKAKKKAAKKK